MQHIKIEEEREAAAEESATAAAAHTALLRTAHLQGLAALPQAMASPVQHPELARLLQALPPAAAAWATAREQLADSIASAVVRFFLNLHPPIHMRFPIHIRLVLCRHMAIDKCDVKLFQLVWPHGVGTAPRSEILVLRTRP